MKKYLAVFLSVMFVLSLATSAFAVYAELPSDTQPVVAKGDTQITLGGELRVRGWYQKNIASEIEWEEVDLGDGAYIYDPISEDSMYVGDGYGNYNKIVHKVPKESDSSSWYDERIRLSVDAKVSPNVEGFIMIETNASSIPIGFFDTTISKASASDSYTWGNFNSKPTDLNILQGWILYKGSGLLGFNAGLKVGHMPLALGEKQFFDHTKFGDDAIVLFMDPTEQLHVGLLAIKFDESATTVNTDDVDGYVGLAVFKINDDNTVGVNYTYINQSESELSHQNLGIHANGEVAGLGYKFSGDLQFGDVGDENFKGYALMLGLDYDLDPVTLRAGLGYGSGDDDFTDDDIDTFSPYLGADQHYTLVYEYRVASATGYTASGLANTTYYNAGVDFSPTSDISISTDAYILRASEASDSKDVGWEVDAKVKYQIAKNLTYQIDAGYFDAGQFYEDEWGVDTKGATVLRHALTLSF